MLLRSLTKALARHGLGLYIYAGEDLPETDEPEPAPVAVPEPITGPRMAHPKQIDWLVEHANLEQCTAMMNKYGTGLERMTYATAEALIAKVKGVQAS